MNTSVIQTNKLRKSYPGLTAVGGIDLEVRRGELFGLVGADGAGKTTTIQMLCTLSRPTGGEARILGLDTVKSAESIKPHIGYMSERFTLYPTLTVEENLDFFARLRHVPAELLEKRKDELLKFSRLERFRNRFSEQLSGGMQKKLALCCSLIHQPEVIFLDEPTNGVDPISRRDFWLIIFRYMSQGMTFFVSTSYLDEAERFNRVALMHQGKIVACDTPKQLEAPFSGKLLQVTTEVPQKTLAVLRHMTGIDSAQVFGDNIHLRVDSSAKRLPEVKARLENEKISLIDIRPVPASLEDIFVSLLSQSGQQPQKPDRPLEILASAADHAGVADKVIKVSELTRKFGNFIAVNRISFEVERGEIFGFLGPNGSGKTTTIRMLCGLLKPNSGRALVLGRDMETTSNQMRTQMGYMSQKFSLFPDLTVAENINFYAGLYGLSPLSFKERKNWVLTMAGLTGKERLLPRELSAGWKQRLALGCAIIHNPQVVFLDEPTSGVDPLSRRFFWELIHELADGGTTILVTTHYMDEAEHCHRLGLMHQGELIAIGSPSRLKTEQTMGHLIEIVCSDIRRAVELLAAQPDYRQVSLFGNAVHLVVKEGIADTRTIQTFLEQSGIPVQSVNRVPFTMEDAFVSIMEKREVLDRSRAGKGA